MLEKAKTYEKKEEQSILKPLLRALLGASLVTKRTLMAHGVTQSIGSCELFEVLNPTSKK